MTNDGDLWEVFARTVEQRVPDTTKISKVETHATWEMVEAGEVKAELERGNDLADSAAERGATRSQKKHQVLRRYTATGLRGPRHRGR